MNSLLLPALVPLSGTSLRIGPRELVLQQDDVARSREQAIVAPVAYDSAWRSSSGQIRNFGGLLALVNVTEPRVVLGFVPDAVAILLALGMTLAQVVACAGLIGLASVQPASVRDETSIAHERLLFDFVDRQQRRVAAMVLPSMRRAIAFVRPVLREPLYLLSLLYTAAVIARPQRADQIDLSTALLLPLATVAVARASQWSALRNWIGMTVLAAALMRVALGGSRAAEALHDPLFWGIVTIVLAMIALFTTRWPVVVVVASALTGGTAACATLLPNVPSFDVAFPRIDLGVIGQSIAAQSDQLGMAATICLIALWVSAIVFPWHSNHFERVPSGARAALIVALMLCLVGALPSPSVGGSWFIGLGTVLGLTRARR